MSTEAERIGNAAYLRTQRSRAIAYLGARWRGQAECRHTYRNAVGRVIVLDRRTQREYRT